MSERPSSWQIWERYDRSDCDWSQLDTISVGVDKKTGLLLVVTHGQVALMDAKTYDYERRRKNRTDEFGKKVV